MANSYLCNTANTIIGRTAINLNARKCPPLQRGDLIYISDMEHHINSRWIVTGIKDERIRIVKKPETSISILQDKILSKTYTDKYAKLSKDDSAILNKHFLHQIKIFPSYDYESKNKKTNEILSLLREIDPKVELYSDSVADLDAINNCRLPDPYSVLIINSFGVITFKCLDKDPNMGDYLSQVKFSNQLKCNKISNYLSSSAQLVDENEELKINHIDAIICNWADHSSIDQLNDLLARNNSATRVFTSDSFIKFVKDIYHRDPIISETERIGIVQSLLPKYINSKSKNIVSEPLSFTPNDTFELDDIQKDTLNQLNQRTYIKASAGSGKTILILAKAYEVASANPKKQFLLLCFNNKLAEDINNQAINTGRSISNLTIKTFDKFLIDLNIPYNLNGAASVFEARKKAFVQLVLSKKLTLSYGGIFVDEVQQMKDEWLSALINCTDENKYMIVSGDYHQSINPSLTDGVDNDFVDEGDSSDYKIGGYNFKTIVLDKNYRNTKPVAKVLKKMVARMNKEAEMLDLSNENKKGHQILGYAYKDSSIIPFCTKTKPGSDEVSRVCKVVDDLVNEYDCAQSDILVICPAYNDMIRPIVNMLSIKYDVCNFATRNSGFAKLSSSGIKVGTIGKSIGLDFRAVVFFNTESVTDFLNITDSSIINNMLKLKHQDRQLRRKYLSVLRNIYVACSRAREILIVFDDSEEETLFSRFIKESGMELLDYE